MKNKQKKKGPESSKVKASGSVSISVQWLSCQLARHFRESGFSFSVLKKVRGIKQPFQTAGGYRNHSTGSLTNVGTNGNYWSSTVSTTNARNLNFNSTNANMNSNNRANGFSLRCLQNWYLPFLYSFYEHVF